MGRKFRHSQTIFSRGELSPRMYGRKDNDAYSKSYKLGRNMRPFPQGSIDSRSGTQHINYVKNSAHNTYLVEFRFSTEQAYALEIGDQYIRVYKDREPVLEASQNITAITQANPAVVTISSHGYSNGDWVYIKDIAGMTELNGRWFIVANSTTNTFELTDLKGDNINSSAFTAYSSGGTAEKVYEITTPWLHTDLEKVSYFQSADVIYFTHADYEVRSLGRVSDTNWTVSIVDFVDGVWLPINGTSTNITPSGTTGSITLTASASLFDSNDVGRKVRLRNSSSSNWGVAKITAVASATSATATVEKTLSGTTASVFWRFSPYGGTFYGYPEFATIHEERFIIGGFPKFPTLVGFSQTGLYTPTSVDFSPSEADGTVIDSNGFVVDIANEEVNDVAFLSSLRTLIVATPATEHSISGAGNSSLQPLTPSSRVNVRQGRYGAKKYVRPQIMGNSTIYVGNDGTSMRELYYEFGIDGYITRDVSLFNTTALDSGAIRTAYQRNPDPAMWVVRNDGKLSEFLFEKINEVEGFSIHELGGNDAKALDVCAIPSPLGSYDDVYLIVSRTDSSSDTVKSVEFITESFEDIEDVKDSKFLDNHITVINAPASNTVSGLWHLEGSTVQVFTDGSPHPDRVVSNGVITLDSDYEKVLVGFSYNRFIDLLPPEVPQLGSIAGEVVKDVKTHVHLYRSVGLEFSAVSLTNLTETPFNGANNLLNNAAPLFSGIITIHPDSNYEKDAVLRIKSGKYLPLTVLHVVREIEINE